MEEIDIEYLAYHLKKAKEKGKPQPIFFLGAGASRSGGIPLAGEIVDRILIDYSDNPAVKRLPENERTYATLMACLLPDERDELLKNYIDGAKINVTHIYLAQLLKEGYADYVLTVNFDNLMLRALALYNIFPSTYDMAILKDLTTSSFKEKSIVYLHGQSHGLWLLNTPEEMEKVRHIVPKILDSIKNRRPWIFIGYSGNDPIFEHLKTLGRFDNGFYWVTYKENSPSPEVEKFISNPHTNASIIKGYDSDAFMLKLSNELGLNQPEIIDTPFTALKNMLDEIIDIDDQEHFRDVKLRLSIARDQSDEAIKKYEKGQNETLEDIEENKVYILLKEIINLILSKKFNEETSERIREKVLATNDNEALKLYATYLGHWGNHLWTQADAPNQENAQELLTTAIEKFEQANMHDPNSALINHDWGVAILALARTQKALDTDHLYDLAFEKLENSLASNLNLFSAYCNHGIGLFEQACKKRGPEAVSLINQAISKLVRAIEIDNQIPNAYNTWGNCLLMLAQLHNRDESNALYSEAFSKYAIAVKIDPTFGEAYFNWANAISDYAFSEGQENVDSLFAQVFEKFELAFQAKPDDARVLLNWGLVLTQYSKTVTMPLQEDLLHQSISKLTRAIEINPKSQNGYYFLANSLEKLAILKEGKESEALFQSAEVNYKKLADLGGKTYNYACLLSRRGKIPPALKYLELALTNHEVNADFVSKDTDWDDLRNNIQFSEILDKFSS